MRPGCATADDVQKGYHIERMTNHRHVIVIGAGVTGLTSAVFLAEEGYDVTIVAAHVPGDSSIEYTSPWAGAHWRTHATPDEPVECNWDVQTYDYWLDMIEREKMEKSGVKMYESFTFWDGDVREELWWAPHVKDFRQLPLFQEPLRSINQRKPANAPEVKNGVAYQSISINVPQYLLYLQEKACRLGAKMIKARLPTGSGLQSALDTAEGVAMANGRPRASCSVNATGLGAIKLCGDGAMFPIRGQTVLVKGEAKSVRTRHGDGYVAYCIPRPGSETSILGGTKEKGNWSEMIDPATTTQILKRCGCVVPELQTSNDGGFEVISVQCGLRPGRQGGPRIEKEVVGGKKCVHAYGHAGAGYQNSIGSARLVVKLVSEIMSLSGASARL